MAGLLTQHQGLRVDEAEGVDNDLALDRLDGVDNDSNGAGGELLEGLLRVYIDRRQPAAKPRVGVVPSNDRLWPGSSSVSW